MKKLLAIAFTLLLTAVCFFSVSASEKVVFVKDGGSGNGQSAASPLGTLDEAYTALGDGGGTIVICGTFTLYAPFIAPAHSGAVTLTNVYGGIDYRTSGGSLTFEASQLRYTLGGETVFKDLNIGCNSTAEFPTGVINTRFNSVTFETGCVMTHPGHRLYLVGGYQGEPEGLDRDSHITMKSGRIHLISGFSRTVTNQTFTGTANINLSGTAHVTHLYIGSVNGSDAGSAVISLSDEANVDFFYLSGDAGSMKGDVTVKADGGNIGQFLRSEFVEGNITLEYNPDKAQSGIADMAQLAGFNTVTAKSEAATTTAPSTAAPTTTAPATAAGTTSAAETTAASNTEGTPATYDFTAAIPVALFVLAMSVFLTIKSLKRSGQF